jgi:antitoxin (DNA-binding transcriptional repressor) of toxin-antitoxin stability system
MTAVKKFLTVQDIRTSPAAIWKQLPKEHEMVITNHGKPIALLTPLTNSDLEDTLKAVRRARATSPCRPAERIQPVRPFGPDHG